MQKELLRAIKRATTVSFDIFDTLLLRPYMRPEDAFSHIERVVNAPGFTAWRTSAEADFYRAHGITREATINDIYSVPGNFAHLRDVEMQWELDTLSANPEMKKVFDFAISSGKRVIIASDMYLPQDFICRLLEKNGYAGYEKLYLSNAINHRKDRGDMYGYILQDLNEVPQDILHIGDNRHSDYDQARRNGLKAWLYKRVSDKYLAENPRAAMFYRASPAIGRSVITAMSAAHVSSGDYWTDFGYKYAGPIVYAYARWIYDTACRRDIRNILFVARDGYIAQKVFNIISRGDIKTDYIYAPRILNYTANLDYDSYLPEQPRIICEYFYQNPGDMSPAAYIQQHFAEFQKMAADEKQRTGYVDYIRRAVADAPVVGVVDTISGQMSAQRLIQKESGVQTHGFYWLTIKGRKCLSEFAHSDFLTDELADAFQSGNRCDLIELIFSAPENPIITLRDGHPVYQPIPNPAEAMRQDIYHRIEAGVLAFTNDIMSRFVGNDLLISSADMFDLIDKYVSMPEKVDIHAMFDVRRSPYADNSVYVPLFSAPTPLWKIDEIRQLVWRTPAQRVMLTLMQPLRVQMRGLKQINLVILPSLPTRVFNISLFNRYGIYIGKEDL